MRRPTTPTCRSRRPGCRTKDVWVCCLRSSDWKEVLFCCFFFCFSRFICSSEWRESSWSFSSFSSSFVSLIISSSHC
jgi:hypothetical protein